MEIRTFTIPECDRGKVEKAVNRQAKKAEKYGIPLKVEYGTPYAKLIKVNSIDPVTNTIHHDPTKDFLCEVFDMTIESEIIRKGEYSVIAKIEHLEGGNVVTTFGETECKPAWATMLARCEHCGGNHHQKTTFIVRDDKTSHETQVGRTCLKDYCGINPQGIGFANELCVLLEDMDADHYDFSVGNVKPALYTDYALSLAVMLQRTKGYTASGMSGSNKEMLSQLISKNAHADDQDIAKAAEIMQAIKAMSREESFREGFDNVKTLIECGYCKASHLGYIAYTPLGYQRYLERMEKQRKQQEDRENERNASDYIGNIGERIVIDIESIKLLTSWETEYGWTYLYKITDKTGNVLVWFASREISTDGVQRIKATIKAHNERDGIKQTVVTRCAVA